MKKIFLAFLILISGRGISQVSISQLPTYTGSPVGTFVPLVQGGSTKKIDGSKLGQVSDSTKIPYLAKNNNFTGNDTFPSIVWASNGSDTLATQSYVRSVGGGGGGSNIDTTRIPFLAKNNTFTGDNSFTTLELNSLTASSVINLGGYGINSFSNDTSLSSSPQYSLPTQNAVTGYVGNHAQLKSNLSNDGTMAANSTTLYPTQQATRTYAAGLVVGLLNDRGSYNASSNVYPSTGGSGTAGAILKGDIWYINTAGTLGGTSVSVGASVRALANSPAQTSSNWDILNVGLGYVPENVANKSTSVSSDSGSTTKYPTTQSVARYSQSLSNLATTITPSDSSSNTLYPSVNAVKRYVDSNSGVLPYKVYNAIISVDGSGVTVNSSYNTFNGITFNWYLVGNGRIELTSSSSIFTTNKTYYFGQSLNNGGVMYLTSPELNFNNRIFIDIIKAIDNSQTSTPSVTFPIEIRVYP